MTFHEGLVKRIFDKIIDSFKTVAVSSRGLIVIKKLMERYLEDKLKTRIIIGKILKDAKRLIMSSIGNYLIQHAL